MTADLPADVRDRAAQAAEAELRRADKWLSRGVSLRVVDAVTAVVAPQIARPLQARIEELEGQVAKQEIAFQGRALLEEMWRKEKAALQARIEELARGEKP